MNKSLSCRVTGRVQMVMFRDFTKRFARSQKLTGFVENKKDGSVYVYAEGGEDGLLKLANRVRKGSTLSRVDEVSVMWGEAKSEFTNFNIKY